MTTHTANGSSFTGFGIEAYRLSMIAMGLKVESRGMRLTAKAPKMSTILTRDYGFKIKKTPDAKVEAAALVTAMAARLAAVCERNEVEHIAKLESLKSDHVAFFNYVKALVTE